MQDSGACGPGSGSTNVHGKLRFLVVYYMKHFLIRKMVYKKVLILLILILLSESL